jgi:hypothetical protein
VRPEDRGVPVPVVDLPLGATEDRVVGALDLERALTQGVKAFEPGLLARANRGFLYIDEVNLLEDHLVDLLIDVAASGENVVEREGLSVRHPARFVLVGSGNPEEGELRPQLLDRFGLSVEVRTPTETGDRVEVVRRRDAFERDPRPSSRTLGEEEDRCAAASSPRAKRLPDVRCRRALERAAQLCMKLGTDGLRGELTLMRAARALAAFDGDDGRRRHSCGACAARAAPPPAPQPARRGRLRCASIARRWAPARRARPRPPRCAPAARSRSAACWPSRWRLRAAADGRATGARYCGAHHRVRWTRGEVARRATASRCATSRIWRGRARRGVLEDEPLATGAVRSLAFRLDLDGCARGAAASARGPHRAKTSPRRVRRCPAMVMPTTPCWRRCAPPALALGIGSLRAPLQALRVGTLPPRRSAGATACSKTT